MRNVHISADSTALLAKVSPGKNSLLRSNRERNRICEAIRSLVALLAPWLFLTTSTVRRILDNLYPQLTHFNDVTQHRRVTKSYTKGLTFRSELILPLVSLRPFPCIGQVVRQKHSQQSLQMAVTSRKVPGRSAPSDGQSKPGSQSKFPEHSPFWTSFGNNLRISVNLNLEARVGIALATCYKTGTCDLRKHH